MSQGQHVPKFGDWEDEKDVPYTAYFDKARKDKNGGKMINPNDPQLNPDFFPVEETLKRYPRQTSGCEGSDIVEVPLPPHDQAKSAGIEPAGGVSTSPSLETTPSRLRSPDKAAAVPKFGEWDESDPASDDGFNRIFNKIRQEKQTGVANVMTMPSSTKGRQAGSKGGIIPTVARHVNVWGNIINQYFHQDSIKDSNPSISKQQGGTKSSSPECSNQGEESHPESSDQAEGSHPEDQTQGKTDDCKKRRRFPWFSWWRKH